MRIRDEIKIATAIINIMSDGAHERDWAQRFAA
jgi:hypothetical protein